MPLDHVLHREPARELPNHADGRTRRAEGESPLNFIRRIKGRGAVSNMQGRFETVARESFDDGWAGAGGDSAIVTAPGTVVVEEQAKSILSRNASPDIPFNVSMNPYRGCEHGCIYCFARPSHSFLGLSPGLDFESRIFAKMNAPQLLREELSRASYAPEPIALGMNTDAYQPCERKLGITRKILEVMQECQQPVAVITKSSLIERDIDILAAMAKRRQAAAAITLTTLDPVLARSLEPRAATPARRLRTIRALTDAGIPVGVSIAPVIPFVTEPELERLLEAVAEAGAISASYIVLRLPWEVSPLFQQWLEAHFPERAARVMNRVREMRGGKDYEADFASRMKGEGVWADLLRQRFEKAATRFGLTGRSGRFGKLDCSHFQRPAGSLGKRVASARPAERLGKAGAQFELF
jgi:DNA repair photolyase